MNQDKNILILPYLELPLSKSFKRFMNINKLKNLEEVLQYSNNELLAMKGYTLRSFLELFNLLQSEGMESLLRSA